MSEVIKGLLSDYVPLVPAQVKKGITSWSFSSLKQFRTCPRQFHEIRVLKNFPRQETEQTIYGTELHAAAENYANGAPLEAGFEFLQPILDALLQKVGKRHAEIRLAVTSELSPCAYDSRRAWCRGIIDLLIVNGSAAWLVDYKTGNANYPDKNQLTLMALLTMAHYPEIEAVNSALLFVMKNVIVKHRVERSEAEKLWWQFREGVAQIDQAYETGVWTPKQSGLCKRHCEVVSCEFNGRHFDPAPKGEQHAVHQIP